MLFKLHYFCQSAGLNAMGILLGVYLAAYTDASPTEIGLLYMLLPFISMIFRPTLCSIADRRQAHREFLICCELLTALSFVPFVIIPYLGDEFHENHPRFCWYLLVVFRIAGDIVFGGASSIGDALAINYATRIGTEFSIYRIWSTIAWMLFGIVTSQLNEIWFLPKHVAGFMVLILASLIDALACYVWPKEYFLIVPVSMMKKEIEQHQLEQKRTGEKKLGSRLTRSLMPKEVVWAHAKKQLWSLVTFSCLCDSLETKTDLRTIAEQTGIPENQASQVFPGKDHAQNKTGEILMKQKANDGSIGKGTQLQTLFLLLRRDPRIIGYLLVFVGAGAARVPTNFFFMSLADICHTQNTCDFASLGGYLQFDMALAETFMFVYINKIASTIGRLNSLSIAFSLASFKYLFYGTIWQAVDPYWSLVPECVTGAIFATFLTLMVEMGHYFSTEVEHLMPELVQRGSVASDDETSREKLKLSLAATMQALLSSANDGLGRGMGALIYGLIIDAYSYQTLWLVIGVLMSSIVVALQLANLLDRCYNVRVGVSADVGPAMAPKPNFDQLEVGQMQTFSSNNKALSFYEKDPVQTISQHEKL